VSFSATECARVRESISAQLDGELSEHELDSLEMHVSVCPACSAWAEEVQGLTHRLREAQPAEPAIGFALPRRRRARASAPVALVAAAAASLVAVLGASHSLGVGSGQAVRSSDFSPQVGAPAVTDLEVQRLGLKSLPTRSPAGVVLQGRFRAL
jgi:predicted anti-sigma-YlaC factor YlaD